ncbi:C1 family peptidase [Bifidobacterium sp. 82T24]|uniref:aminopeptidase C n=1 Tax=Bifidobacterium pluvialisilvae TaxID=2834436 RepID=UPI001C58BD68|nr:C1 family peptidase [Bifidobacterium pluvialisilvae]MBW3088270.1 C1 family peptidase [Bifidobacterium pluvialisilvae]
MTEQNSTPNDAKPADTAAAPTNATTAPTTLPQNAELTANQLGEYSALFNADRANIVAATAATSSGVLKAATDYRGLRALPREFSIELKQGSITSQRHSGRCWMFASLNVLRQDVMRRWNLDDFEFSETYLFFYDKLEKSNHYLEKVLETLDEPTDSRLFQAINDYPADDGGWWAMFAALAAKYGLVPKSAYPENANSRDSDALTQYLNAKLREFALELRSAHARGEGADELRGRKSAMMNVVYRIVAVALGEPPRSFDWVVRGKDDDDADTKTGDATAEGKSADAGATAGGKDSGGNSADAKKSDAKKPDDGFVKGKVIAEYGITPMAFYAKYVKQDLDRYVGLVNAPMKRTPFGRLYRLAHDGNVVGGQPIEFANVPLDVFKKAIIDQLRGGRPVWFACDCDQFALRGEGVFDRATVRVEDLFGIEYTMGKGDRLEYGVSPSNHAMTLIGVNLDADGKPNRWKIENSWGKDAGRDGYFTATDAWFDDYVNEVAIHDDVLDDATKAIFGTKPVMVQPWEPISRATRCM